MLGSCSIKLANVWLERTRAKDGPNKGGIYEGYDLRKKGCSFLYTEITGYAISIFLNLYRWTGDNRYLSYSIDAFNYLHSIKKCLLDSSVSLPHSFDVRANRFSNRFYAFDNAVCLAGIIDYYNAVNDERASVLLREVGQWLVSSHYGKHFFKSCYDNHSKSFLTTTEFWGDKGCLHVKNIISLIKLWETEKDSKLLKIIDEIVQSGLQLQLQNGAIRVTEKLGYIFTHTHCYAVEGLLFYYWKFPDKKQVLDAVFKAGKWLLKAQNPDGSLYTYYYLPINAFRKKANNLKTTDATAQSIRIWYTLSLLTGDSSYKKAIEKAIGYLCSIQITTDRDKNATGGFYYKRYPLYRLNLCSKSKIVTWGVMFAIHAMEMVDAGHNYNTVMRDMF